MGKRERAPRKQSIYYLKAFDRISDQLIGHVVDFTTEGMMLLSENPIEPDTAFRVRVELPEAIRGRADIVLDAESIWCKKDANPDLYDTGFRLLTVSREDVALIGEVMQRYSFEN